MRRHETERPDGSPSENCWKGLLPPNLAVARKVSGGLLPRCARSKSFRA